MPLSDQLGISLPDDDIDPQSVLTDLVGQREPTLVQNGGVDPQSVLNRLIRKGLAQRQPAQTPDRSAPPDFASFGDVRAPSEGRGGTDFAQFGHAISGDTDDGTTSGEGKAASESGSEMPDAFNAALQGLKSGVTGVRQTAEAIGGKKPTPEGDQSPAAAPFEWGDITSPLSQAAPKLAYRLAKSAPTLAAGLAGGALGGVGAGATLGPEAAPAGALAGGAVGAAAGAAFQTLGPAFGEELKKTPDDPDGAWDRAMHNAEISGAFSGAGWALFPFKFFDGPVKQLAFQAFGVQPGVSMAEQAAHNVAEGKPVGEGLGPAYVEGALGTAVPLAGHHLLNAAIGKGASAKVEPGATSTPGGGSYTEHTDENGDTWRTYYEAPNMGAGGRYQWRPKDGPDPDQQPHGPADGASPQGDSDGGSASGAGPQGGPQTAPNAKPGNSEAPPEPPQPFETKMKRSMRDNLEERAAYYKEFSDGEIASWPDDRLKEYVNSKTGFGTYKNTQEDDSGLYARADDVLRRYGFSDEEIAGMSPAQRKANIDEALRAGTHAGPEPRQPGTRAAPVDIESADDVARAASVVDTDPTPAQAQAGNYQKAHVRWQGLDIAIENPAGSVRKGPIDPSTGEPAWQARMPVPYGYVKRTSGADGDHVDVFMGPRPEGNPVVYVMDQREPDGGFDEHKAFVGFASPFDALQAYLGSRGQDQHGPARIGGMRAMSVDEFKQWLKAGDTKAPVSEAMAARAQRPQTESVLPDDTAGPEHHDAVETALRNAGIDPSSVRPADIARAAEISAQEGAPPEEAFPTAVLRSLVEDGHITPEAVKEAVGDEAAADLLETGHRPERQPRAAPHGTAADRSTAAAAGELAARGAGTGQEPRPQAAESVQPEKPARDQATGSEGEAAAAGHPENGPGARRNAASGQQPAEAGGAETGNAAEHQRPAAAAQAALIGARAEIPEHKVTAADGQSVPVAPVVVEAKDLITSSDPGYDKALQPRQRSRAASQAQIREIATRLDPERLGYSAEADRGAPIVGPDRMVESGNGRIQALRAIYRTNPPNAKRYRDWLQAQGVDVARYKEPVLVRQRLTPLDNEGRRAFAIAANQAATLAMSAPERALADADHLDARTLELIRNGENLAAAENRGFIRAFVAAVPASERGALTTADGALSAEGLTRAKNAILARAYGDADVISRITESTDDDIKSISNALVMGAPVWAKLRAEIEAGHVRADMDLTDDLMAAVKKTADIRAKGQKLQEFLAQADAFERLPQAVETWMRMFYDGNGNRAAGSPRIAERLRFYAEQAAKVSDDPTLDLGAPEVTAHDIQRLAAAKDDGHWPGARHGQGHDVGRAQGGRPRPAATREEPSGRDQGEPRSGFAEPEELYGRREREPAAARLTGDELGPAASFEQLRAAAYRYYEDRFVKAGLRVRNARTGFEISFSPSGLRRTTRVGEDLLRIIPAIPDMLRRGVLIRSEPDRRGRRGVNAVHTFAAAAEVGGRHLDVVLTVRETKDGNFQYSLHRDRDFDTGTRPVSSRPQGGEAPFEAPKPPALEGDPGDLNIAPRERIDKPPEGSGGFAEPGNPFDTEPGAEGKPQLVIPGTERVSQADLAKRKGAEPLKPKVAQKLADEGLFSDKAQQLDLVDMAGRPPPSRSANKSAAEVRQARETGPSDSGTKSDFSEPEGSFGAPARRRHGVPAAAREAVSEFRTDDRIKAHADYRAAKGGDTLAAARLVRDVVSERNIAAARQKFGADAIYAPVVAIEQSGHNRIPAALAEYYAAKTGSRTAEGLVQANRAFHTGAGPMERLASRAIFNGPVERGGKYVLVDDVSVMGSTLADFADYIQSKGGNIVGVVTLVNAGRSGVLRARNAEIRDIEGRFGDAVREDFGLDPSSLTADEAAYLRNFRDAESLRTRLAAARRQRSARLAAKGVREERLGEEPSAENTSGAPSGAVSDSGFEETAPPFYSQVARTVDAAKQDKASPQQWLATIKNTPGVKPEELEWLGLDDWLKEQKGTVTKQQIADYIRANEIQVREVEKGPRAVLPEVREDDLSVAQTEHQWVVTAPNGKSVNIGKGTVGSEEEARAYAERYFNNQIASHNNKPSDTKFQQYTLPGGENYRELLLTLQPEPFRKPDLAKRQVVFDRYRAQLGELNERMLRPGISPEERNAALTEYQRISEQRDQEAEAVGPEQQPYRGPHWDEPNILAHIRFDDRAVDGKKTLHIAEVQSDWHQAGRKKGYKGAAKPTRSVAEIDREMDENLAELRRRSPSAGPDEVWQLNPDLAARHDELQRERNAAAGLDYGVPDAPFKTTWPELALKRMVRYAAEHGYDRITWDTGETNAERYDLSKQIAAVNAEKLRYGGKAGQFHITAEDHTGRLVLNDVYEAEQLPDVIGKELADKIIADAPNNPDGKSYSGLDLKVGGEGMLGFYDDILPKAAAKLTKKFGGRVGYGTLEVSKREGNALSNALNDMLEEAGEEPTHARRPTAVAVHVLDITPQLRDAAVEQGFPLFQPGQPFKADPVVSVLRELARNDDLFAYPKSPATDFASVLRDIDPSLTYEGAIGRDDVPDPRATRGYIVGVGGRDAIVLENDKEVWANLTDVGEGHGGSALYAAIADYAHNTGRTFIGDPEGLSNIALRRRTENMLSSALKHGTTAHLAPHPRQIQGDTALGVPPLRWTEGDHVGNLRGLIDTSVASLAHHVPGIRKASYDFATGTFRTGQGHPITAQFLQRMSRFARRGGAPGVGSRTLKRGILLNTLLRGTGSTGGDGETGGRDGLLVRSLSVPHQLVTGTPLARSFYAPDSNEVARPGRDLGPFRWRSDAPFGEQAQDYVLAQGRRTGLEHLLAVDADGSVVSHSRGTRNSTGSDAALGQALANPARSIVVHHNHPGDRTLSGPDLAMLGLPGLHAVWAHGHAGHVARAELTPEAKALLRRFGPNDARRRLFLVYDALNRGPLYDFVHAALDNGHITAEEANGLLPHVTALAFQRGGVLDYEANGDWDALIDRLGLQPYIDRAARVVAGRLLNARAATATADRRSAGGVRHVGDVGATFERSAATRRGDAAAPRDDRLRRGDDRAQTPGEVAASFAEGGPSFRSGPKTSAGGAGAGAPPPGGARTTAAAPQQPPRPIIGKLATLRTVQQFKRFWTSTFQPELFSDRALEADPLFARYKAASAQEKDAVIQKSESEWEYWNKRSDAARVRFLDDIETAGFGNVPPDRREADMARRYRAMLDANWRLEQQYGSKAAFVEDYFPHIWEKPEEWQAFAEARSAQVGPTWFQKKRTIDYITDGLAAGLKLKYTNPVDILVHRLMSGVDMRQRMELLYKLKDMGLAWEGAQGGDMLVRRGWRAINAPDRKQWVIAPDVQSLWANAVEAKGLWQAEHIGGSMFRGWMTLKNAWVPIKLALSAFHPLHVLHINYSNGLARAWDDLGKGQDLPAALKSAVGGFMGPIQAAPGASAGAAVGAAVGTATPAGPFLGGVIGSIAGAAAHGAAKRVGLAVNVPHKGRQAREAWAKRPSQQNPEEKAMVALMTDGGFVPQLSEQLKIASKRQLAVAWQRISRGEAGTSDWRKFASAAMRRPIEALQAPIFEQWIPNLKAAAFLDGAAALLKRRPQLLNNDTERRIALRAIARSIDNRYGEMTYGTLFWNRTVKDGAIASFLSAGWNVGFVREFGGAAMESITRPAGLLPPFKPNAGRKTIRNASNKIAFALAYVGTAALINGIMTYLFTGKQPDGLDYIFARIGGENPDGSPRRVTNMFYLREIPMLLKHIQERGGNILSGLGEMLWNKLMFEPFHELLNNRNYYGYNIWDEGAPIYKQVWQALRHFLGDQTNPMSIGGAKHAAELSGKPFPSASEAIAHPGKILEAAGAKGVGLSLLGFGPAPSYVEKSPIQNRINYLYQQHVAPISRPEEQGENTEEKMAVRQAILIAKRDKDSKALQEAYARGKAIGLTPRYMQQVGVTPTDVYLFSRLPNEDQKAILLQANKDELRRYWPKAHVAVRVQLVGQHGRFAQ